MKVLAIGLLLTAGAFAQAATTNAMAISALRLLKRLPPLLVSAEMAFCE